MQHGSESSPHLFGGDWTDKKLEILAQYLPAYTQALKAQRFRLGYIDAFAGSGYREPRRRQDADAQEAGLFAETSSIDSLQRAEGSAARALHTDPPFDSYVFIEMDAGRAEQLEALRGRFPDVADRIDVRRAEANQAIRELCSRRWENHRAVLFLDPYGMQVEWRTIEAIAATKAIDLWLLVPLGIGPNRLLPRSGQVPESWKRRLDVFLGTTDWCSDFYTKQKEVDLFGNPVERVVKQRIETLIPYFIRRLESVFPGVAPKPKVLWNSTGCPLYLLCFAVSNPDASALALKIANHTLRRV